jgi:hypothetical protein
MARSGGFAWAAFGEALVLALAGIFFFATVTSSRAGLP